MYEQASDVKDDIRKHGYTERIYVNPPDGARIEYPCFIIEHDGYKQIRADNRTMIAVPKYKITHILNHYESGNFVQEFLYAFSHARHTGQHVSDNLYHDYFLLY